MIPMRPAAKLFPVLRLVGLQDLFERLLRVRNRCCTAALNTN
jgi:hypothetical protein